MFCFCPLWILGQHVFVFVFFYLYCLGFCCLYCCCYYFFYSSCCSYCNGCCTGFHICNYCQCISFGWGHCCTFCHHHLFLIFRFSSSSTSSTYYLVMLSWYFSAFLMSSWRAGLRNTSTAGSDSQEVLGLVVEATTEVLAMLSF